MQIVDQFGNPFVGALDYITGQTLTDSRPATALLATVAAEALVDLNGNENVLVDLRSAAANLTIVFEGTTDGTNYDQLSAYNVVTNAYVPSVVYTTTAADRFLVSVTGYRRMRVRVSARTSGNITVAMRATQASAIVNATELPLIPITVTAAAASGATLTIPSGGVGMFHYIYGISITRTATAALVGSATLVITTTNLPNSHAWSVGNAMALGDTQIDVNEMYSAPIRSSVAATATTIVAPAPGAAVLWRINAYYRIGQ